MELSVLKSIMWSSAGLWCPHWPQRSVFKKQKLVLYADGKSTSLHRRWEPVFCWAPRSLLLEIPRKNVRDKVMIQKSELRAFPEQAWLLCLFDFLLSHFCKQQKQQKKFYILFAPICNFRASIFFFFPFNSCGSRDRI